MTILYLSVDSIDFCFLGKVKKILKMWNWFYKEDTVKASIRKVRVTLQPDKSKKFGLHCPKSHTNTVKRYMGKTVNP